jgi:hypothetical protein
VVTTTTNTTAAADAAVAAAIAAVSPPDDWELLASREDFHDAQRRYPHDAGVFVGNLPIRLTDLQLLHEVKRAFRKYGQCEAMVKRKTGKPWAIVQFRVCLHLLPSSLRRH